MVFVNKDGEPPFESDIRFYSFNLENPLQHFINLNILSPNLDLMCRSILFPYGEPGCWSCEAYDGAQENRSRVNVTTFQYKVALTAISDDFNSIIAAGKHTHQYILDSYLQVDANNLNFIRMHQLKLRNELYQGLADHVEFENGNAGMTAGIPVILSLSFEGSQRNMRENGVLMQCPSLLNMVHQIFLSHLQKIQSGEKSLKICDQANKHLTVQIWWHECSS